MWHRNKNSKASLIRTDGERTLVQISESRSAIKARLGNLQNGLSHVCFKQHNFISKLRLRVIK
jgi:hypothetical protein